MKQSLDFTEIKEFCDKVGLNCQIIDEGVIITKPKDIWDGVEFFEGQDGVIRPMNDDMRYIINNGKIHITSKPSTESDYIEQLKKEAHERFGDIKKGDEFINTRGHRIESNASGFEYKKDGDILCCGLVYIYESGKWAERVKERVMVQPTCITGNEITFKVSNKINSIEMYDLAQQLEKYLNGEIE